MEPEVKQKMKKEEGGKFGKLLYQRVNPNRKNIMSRRRKRNRRGE